MAFGLAELLILKCTDELGERWTIVEPDAVPEWLKEPDIMEMLVSGHQAQAPGDSVLYMALKSGTVNEQTPLARKIITTASQSDFH